MCDSKQVNYFKNLLFYVCVPSSSTWTSNFLNNRLAFCQVCVTPIWSRQDNNTFHIGWKDQDNIEIFKNLQERDNNYRNIALSLSREALVKIETTYNKFLDSFDFHIKLAIKLYIVCKINDLVRKFSCVYSRHDHSDNLLFKKEFIGILAVKSYFVSFVENYLELIFTVFCMNLPLRFNYKKIIK